MNSDKTHCVRPHLFFEELLECMIKTKVFKKLVECVRVHYVDEINVLLIVRCCDFMWCFASHHEACVLQKN